MYHINCKILDVALATAAKDCDALLDRVLDLEHLDSILYLDGDGDGLQLLLLIQTLDDELHAYVGACAEPAAGLVSEAAAELVRAVQVAFLVAFLDGVV